MASKKTVVVQFGEFNQIIQLDCTRSDVPEQKSTFIGDQSCIWRQDEANRSHHIANYAPGINSMPHLPHLGHRWGKTWEFVIKAWPHGSGKVGHLSINTLH